MHVANVRFLADSQQHSDLQHYKLESINLTDKWQYAKCIFIIVSLMQLCSARKCHQSEAKFDQHCAARQRMKWRKCSRVHTRCGCLRLFPEGVWKQEHWLDLHLTAKCVHFFLKVRLFLSKEWCVCVFNCSLCSVLSLYLTVIRFFFQVCLECLL